MVSWNRPRPGEPSHTCPLIDDAINHMEKVRSANGELRDWGREQYDRATEAERELDKALRTIEDHEQTITDLKSQISELDDRIEFLVQNSEICA